MAEGFALEIQKGIRAALVANSDVTALVSTRIYDEPPHDVTFPYVRFGTIVPRAFDTDGSIGASVNLNIEAYSRETGRVEAARIAEAIRAALHRQESSVSVTNHNLIELICETYIVDQDNEGRGYDANIVFSAIIETA
jgi:hypothetical protein